MQTSEVTGEPKIFLSKKNYQLEELHEPLEEDSLEITAPNQTLTLVLSIIGSNNQNSNNTTFTILFLLKCHANFKKFPLIHLSIQ